MLVSFQLASKYHDSLVELCDNLEQLAVDPTCFEVLVKIDAEDPAMQAAVTAEIPKRKFRLRPLVTPRRRGYEDLWKALNELYHLTDPGAYFVCNINDEIRIREKGWDERLRRYVGLFPDNIFRLRTSRLKFHNYYDFWECGYAPENYAFFTKRWLDICGDWNPCFGPDSSQQYIAYYLGYANHPSIKQYNRDVPILDLSWSNEGVGHNLTPAQQEQRTAVNFRLWSRQISHPMQEELYRRARLLQANIIQAECENLCPIEIADDRSSRTILLRDARDGTLLDLLPYKISRIGLFLRNLHRRARFTFFAGGGRDSRNLLPISIIEYLFLRHLWLRRLSKSLSRRRFHFPRLHLDRLRPVRLPLSRLHLGRLNFVRPLAAATSSLVNRIRRPMPASVRNSANPRWGRLRKLLRPLRPLWAPTIALAVTLVSGCRTLASRVLRLAFGAWRFLALGVRRLALGVWWLASKAFALIARAFRKIGLGLRTVTSASVWRHHGHRLSLALMDRDVRWLRIKQSDRQKIAAIRDPWFDPLSKPAETLDAPVVANPHDPEIQDTSLVTEEPSEADRTLQKRSA